MRAVRPTSAWSPPPKDAKDPKDAKNEKNTPTVNTKEENSKFTSEPLPDLPTAKYPDLDTPQPLSVRSGIRLQEFAPRITVIGVGGGGSNAINNMISRGLKGVDFICCNTDAQHLATTLSDKKVQMGRQSTQGLGCGADPQFGRVAAEESREELAEMIGDAHMCFITAGRCLCR